MLFQRIEFSMFLGYLESKKECVVSVLFDRISNPLERKALYIPSSLSEIFLFHTPIPLGISVTLHGGGGGCMDIFWNHTLPEL